MELLGVVICISVLIVTGQSVRVGIVYDGSVTDQIRQTAVKRAALSHTNGLSVVEGRENNQDLQLLWRPLNASNAKFALEEVCGLLESGIQGLVTILPCRSRHYIISQADMFHLPHVTVKMGSCDTLISNQYTLHMDSNISHLDILVQDITNNMGWKSAGLIFDDSVDSVQRRSIVFSLSAIMTESSIVVVDKEIIDTGNLTSALKRLVAADIETIIIQVKSQNLEAILTESHGLGLLNNSFYWIILGDDLLPDEAFAILTPYVDSNVLLVRRSWSGSRKSRGGHCNLPNCLQETECSQFCPYLTLNEASLADAIAMILHASNEIAHLEPATTPMSCLATNNYTVPNGQQIVDIIKQGDVAGFTTCQGFDHNGFLRQIDYELYSLFNSSETPLPLVGTWDTQSGLNIINAQRLFLNKFYDFGGRMLKVATLESHPFCFLYKEGNTTLYKGFAFDILNQLADRLKFSYEIVEPPDRLYGAPNPDGTWNGMVGMVMRGEVDLAVGPFTITSIRESVIDFTKPYLEDSTGILTRRPQDEDSQLFQMFKPYSGEVWGAIAAATVFVGIISYLVNYNTPYSGIRQALPESTTDEVSFSENLWLIYSSAMEQGATYHPNATSGRLVLGFFWIFTIVVVATYTANLAAFLTVSVPYTPINSLGELLAQSEVQPVVKDGTNLWAMFQSSKKGIYVDVWERLQTSPRATVTEDALAFVETGEYAYLSDTALLQYIALSGCTFAVANEVFNTAGYGFVMPENAPFEKAVNYNIMKMQEAGLIEKWRQKWWASDGANCHSDDRTGSATSLSLSNLGGAFLVYIIVAGISIICLGLEIFSKSSGIMRKLRNRFHKPLTSKTNGVYQNGKEH